MVLFDSFKTERGFPVKLAICKTWISSHPSSNGCQGTLSLWCNGIFAWGFQMACGGASCMSCGIESPYSHSAPLPRTLCTSPASIKSSVNTRAAGSYKESYRWSWHHTQEVKPNHQRCQHVQSSASSLYPLSKWFGEEWTSDEQFMNIGF